MKNQLMVGILVFKCVLQIPFFSDGESGSERQCHNCDLLEQLLLIEWLLTVTSWFTQYIHFSHSSLTHEQLIIGATIRRPNPGVYSEAEGCTDAPVAVSLKDFVSSHMCKVL